MDYTTRTTAALASNKRAVAQHAEAQAAPAKGKTEKESSTGQTRGHAPEQQAAEQEHTQQQTKATSSSVTAEAHPEAAPQASSEEQKVASTSASVTQAAANSPRESPANVDQPAAPEEGKSDEKPYVIKLRAPSKKSEPSAASKQATTVHLEPVASEKIESKKEEQPASSSQKADSAEAPKQAGPEEAAPKAKTERRIESVEHIKKKPSHKKKTKKGRKKNQHKPTPKSEDLEGALSSSLLPEPLELARVSKHSHSDAGAVQSLMQSNQKESAEVGEGSAAKAQLDFDEFAQRLDAAMRDHQGLSQRARVEETFHQFAQAASEESPSGSASSDWINENTLSKDMAFAATKQVLESWDLTMTEGQEKRFRESHFEPTWNKYAQMGVTVGKNNLSNQYATAFIKDIASLNKEELSRIKGGAGPRDNDDS